MLGVKSDRLCCMSEKEVIYFASRLTRRTALRFRSKSANFWLVDAYQNKKEHGTHSVMCI